MVYKFPLEITDEQYVTVPRGASLLHIGAQPPFTRLQSWWLVDPDEAEEETRVFTISGTGHELPPLATATTHRGTVVDPSSGLVWHVFEAID